MGSGYLVQRGGGKDYSVFKARVDGSLTEVTAEMLDGITTIAGIAFYGCPSLKSVIIPNSVTSIGSSAFNGCSALTSIDIPSGVTYIGQTAFTSCSALASVTIPSSVTSIGRQAFTSCSALASVTIKDGATGIGDYVFNWCSRLESVTVEATTPPTLGTNAFDGTHADLVIYVPAESVDAYKSATNWSNYASRIQAIPST